MAPLKHDIEPKIRLASTTDFGDVVSLLRAASLTTEGLAPGMDALLVAYAGTRIIGCSALELAGETALLRSVAVEEAYSGKGVGTELVKEAHKLALRRGARRVFLLTTTAKAFFQRFGYLPVDRGSLPEEVRNSAEFSSCEAAGAIAMYLRL